MMQYTKFFSFIKELCYLIENIFEIMKMPSINKRILELVQTHTQGNVSKFAKLCNMSSSQKLNRIFSVDNVSKRFPVPSTEIILDIANNFSEIDLNWLIRGNTLSKNYQASESNQEYRNHNIEEIIANKVAEKLIPKINRLTEEIERLESEIRILNSSSN